MMPVPYGYYGGAGVGVYPYPMMPMMMPMGGDQPPNNTGTVVVTDGDARGSTNWYSGTARFDAATGTGWSSWYGQPIFGSNLGMQLALENLTASMSNVPTGYQSGAGGLFAGISGGGCFGQFCTACYAGGLFHFTCTNCCAGLSHACSTACMFRMLWLYCTYMLTRLYTNFPLLYTNILDVSIRLYC